MSRPACRRSRTERGPGCGNPGPTGRAPSAALPRSSGQVALVEHGELVPAERVLRHLRMFEAQGQRRTTVGTRQEGIGVVDVQLRLEQRAEHALQLPLPFDLDGDDRGLGEREPVLLQQRPGTVRVVHDQPDDGAVRRVQQRERQDMDLMFGQTAHDLVHPAELVRDEHAELFHRSGGASSCGPRRVDIGQRHGGSIRGEPTGASAGKSAEHRQSRVSAVCSEDVRPRTCHRRPAPARRRPRPAGRAPAPLPLRGPDETEVLRQRDRPRVMGIPQGPPQRARSRRPAGLGRAHQGELPPGLRRRPDRGGLSGRRLVPLVHA